MLQLEKGAANTTWSQGKEPAASMATTYGELDMTGYRNGLIHFTMQSTIACCSVQPLEESRV